MKHQTEHKDDSKLYIACLGSCNDSETQSNRILIAENKSKLLEKIKETLFARTNFDLRHVHKSKSFSGTKEYEKVAFFDEKVKFIEKYGEIGKTLLNFHYDVRTAIILLEDKYCGEWYSELEFSTELFNEVYADNLPEDICRYINYEAFNTSIFKSSYFSINVNDRVHVFCH